MSSRYRAAVVGASGYTGAELLRLLADHPAIEVARVCAASHAGESVASLYPHLGPRYGGTVFVEPEPAELEGFDLVFFATPHGTAARIVPELSGTVGTIVDLSADFRLKDPSQYETWYGAPHPAPHLLEKAAFGIPELFRKDIAGSSLVAAAGCYVTAASLTLAPLVRAGVVEPGGVIVDGASGVSGAGRTPSPATQFSAADENLVAYGLLNHRHTPEIEQATGAQVLFTPHLVPMTRGILVTCYARPSAGVTGDEVRAALDDHYRDEPFVHVVEEPPATKDAWGSNSAFVTSRLDDRTGWVVALGALDNLVKGASGQAVQCANLALGLPEVAGLPVVGVYP